MPRVAMPVAAQTTADEREQLWSCESIEDARSCIIGFPCRSAPGLPLTPHGMSHQDAMTERERQIVIEKLRHRLHALSNKSRHLVGDPDPHLLEGPSTSSRTGTAASTFREMLWSCTSKDMELLGPTTCLVEPSATKTIGGIAAPMSQETSTTVCRENTEQAAPNDRDLLNYVADQLQHRSTQVLLLPPKPPLTEPYALRDDDDIEIECDHYLASHKDGKITWAPLSEG